MTHDEWLLIRKLYVDAMTLQALANRLVADLKPLADQEPDDRLADQGQS
jgi:hypothetical protein